jgi:putative endonuclease
MNLGKQGEDIALRYLESKGYEPVAKNFRFDRAEIDLIVKDEKNKVLVFVEVKTRSSKLFGEAQESVVMKKQEQIIKSAQGFLMEHEEFAEYEKRFDVVAVYVRGKNPDIIHFENAF